MTHTVAGIGYVKNNEGDRYQYDRKYDEYAEDLNDDRAIREYMENDVFHCHDDAGYDNVNQVRPCSPCCFVFEAFCCSEEWSDSTVELTNHFFLPVHEIRIQDQYVDCQLA